MANNFETKIRAWLTPGLITVFGMISWTLIEEIRSDVKQLLNSDAKNQVRIESLEMRMSKAESVIYGERLFATKPEELEVPKPKKRS